VAAGRPGKTFATVLITVFVLLAALGLAARLVAQRIYGDTELVPSPRIHLAPDRLITVAGIPVTNTLVSSSIATLVLVLVFWAARANSRFVPRRLGQTAGLTQEWIYSLLVSFAGPKRASALYPVAATFFLYILANAWIALLPIYGPVVGRAGDGQEVPLLRGAGSDINMPLALALVSFLVVQAGGSVALRRRYLGRFFPTENLRRGRLFEGAIELTAGLFHLLTEFTRLLSFAFRLFGTMLAGEVLILVSTFLAPLALSVPFYGLELVVGALQAVIFTVLTVAFTVMAMTSEEEAENGRGN
jgi:F-type H+-transporting ATPase subunit a